MISLHIKVDGLSQPVLDRALLYLQRTKQRNVQITAGAELLKGMQFVERVRDALPKANIFWRNLSPEDTGIHTKYTPQQVYDLKVKPNLTWFQANKVIFMPDNESSGNDAAMQSYATWMVTFLGLMHAVNLRTAVCRFSTGNIAESQYVLLKPIFSAMRPTDYISPNEYSNAPGKSSGGHLERYKLMWKAAGKNLLTTIGEAGVCPNYDPGKGFRSIGMTGKAYCDQMIAEEVWYLNGTIDRFLFLVGKGWDSFSLINEIGGGRVEADTLDALEGYYASHPIPPEQPPVQPPVIQPPPTDPPPQNPPGLFLTDAQVIYALKQIAAIESAANATETAANNLKVLFEDAKRKSQEVPKIA